MFNYIMDAKAIACKLCSIVTYVWVVLGDWSSYKDKEVLGELEEQI